MNSYTGLWIFGLVIFSAFANMPKSAASDAETVPPLKWGEAMVFEEPSKDNQKLPAYSIEIFTPKSTPKMTAAEYADQQARKTEPRYPETVNPKIRQLIYLLQVRKFIKTIVPLPLPF